MMKWAAVLLSLLFAGSAYATGWKDGNHSAEDCLKLDNGRSCSWTETSTVDSDPIYAGVIAECVNTHATNDFTVYASDPAGDKLYVYWGPVIHGQSCAPAAGTDTCGSVELLPGWYVFDPDGTGASALCQAHGRLN